MTRVDINKEERAMPRRLSYVGSKRCDKFVKTVFETFRNLKAMFKFAQNPENSGTYYISFPDMTCSYTREKILELSKEGK